MPTADLAELSDAEIVLGVVPAQAMRAVARLARPFLREGAAFVACATGVERGGRKFMSEVIADEARKSRSPRSRGRLRLGRLQGAADGGNVSVEARGGGAAARRAIVDQILSAVSLHRFARRRNRRRGQERAGDRLRHGGGAGTGRQRAAALIARGFAELARLGAAWGARQETLMGLSGLGDLVLTCGSAQSRNFALGEALGRGEPPRDASHGKLAEGAYTASALVEIARERRVEMPIAEAVDAILAGRMSVETAINTLLMRPLHAEA